MTSFFEVRSFIGSVLLKKNSTKCSSSASLINIGVASFVPNDLRQRLGHALIKLPEEVLREVPPDVLHTFL